MMNLKLIANAAGSPEISLPTPQWGYETKITQAFRVGIAPNGTAKSWDNGQQYDTRQCKARFLLTASEIVAAHDFLTNEAFARAADFFLQLPVGSGFYPFGADMGDIGTYTVREVKYSRGSRLNRPYNRFYLDLSLVLVASPEYSIPAGVSQGDLAIGNVMGLPYPKVTPSYKKPWETDVSSGGVPHTLDRGASAGYDTTEIEMEMNAQNAAQFLSYLTTFGRAGDISITSPPNRYIFGSNWGASGTYIVRATSNEITADHVAWNRFRIRFNCILKQRVE